MIQNIVYKDITIRLPELKLEYRGDEIHSSMTELRILLLLLEDPYRIVPIEELSSRGDMVSANALWVYASRLRIKLDRKYVYNRRGVGYSLEKKKIRRIGEW